MTFIPDSSSTTESRPAGARQTPAEPEMASPTPSPPPQPPPKFLFRVFAGVIAAFVALGWSLAAATASARWCIRKRQKKLFVYLVAALQCIFIPYGTLLGVMTFLTIGSPAGQLEFSGRVS